MTKIKTTQTGDSKPGSVSRLEATLARLREDRERAEAAAAEQEELSEFEERPMPVAEEPAPEVAEDKIDKMVRLVLDYEGKLRCRHCKHNVCKAETRKRCQMNGLPYFRLRYPKEYYKCVRMVLDIAQIIG